MKQLAEIQEGDSQEISRIKQSHFRRCGSTRSHPKGKCPAWGTTCSACEKKKHWAKMCTNKNENKWRHVRAWTAQISNSSQSREYQTKKGGNRICSMKSDKRKPNELYKEFEQLAFDVIQQQKDDRTEFLAELRIKLPNKPGTHTLKAKVDTGSESNTLPLITFQRMFSNK